MRIKCQRCGYTWEARVKAPKACPRCKARLDAAFIRIVKGPPLPDGNWEIVSNADDAAQDAAAEETYGQLERGEIKPGGEIPY